MASARSWRDLARHGRHGEAFAVLGADGLARESKRLGVNDLLALADVARLSGHPAEAVAPLERILTDFASDAQASLAAFALGRLELDSLGRAQAAAAALNKALALGIPRSLREDVRARLVEAYARGGDPSAARRAAAAYFEEYPHGRHARAIEGWLHPR
jgi:transmembrane sensor